MIVVLYFYKITESPCCDVPITASGPQVSNTLLSMNNAGKGIRQNRPVTLGKGLALVVRVGEGFCGEVNWIYLDGGGKLLKFE